jgi:1,2-phenylacetyl-CoA epoxidase PaaB subunit
MRTLWWVALALVLLQHTEGPEKLGVVHFRNSCTAPVQASFERGMALLHSFEFGPAIDAFKATVDGDPGCAIAYWGIGLAQWGNPFAIMTRPAAQLRAGRASVQLAIIASARTPRERDYVSALAALYAAADGVDQRTRMSAYRDQMEAVAAKYPDDAEAATFYALALAAAADPADKTYADQLKAGAMLEKLWVEQPDHPGIAHYIIHSYDVPALAPHAIDAARRYGTIAPDAPHALHMPSHTFTRLGYWQDSIDANILSAAAAHKAGATDEELHATDYEVYAYLQTGQDAAAKRLVDSLGAIEASAGAAASRSAAPPAAGAYALAAIPARYALERGAWQEAEALDIHRTAFAYPDAISWFARAIGGARNGDIGVAKDAIDELQKVIERLQAQKEAYWSEQVAIQKLGAEAWVAMAEGDDDVAVATMREAADREDRTEKAAITPGPLAPAREMLGDILLELKRPKDALVEFRKTMGKEPNRFRAIAGAARAATASGDRAAARTYYSQLLTICVKADNPGRKDLQAARTAVR